MTHSPSADITQRLAQIEQHLAVAAPDGRSHAVTLIAVSKKQPEHRIIAALDAGQRTFGENRVQEAQQRWTEKLGQFDDLKLHLIGPLQTNKVEAALRLFDVIETLDRIKLARALAKAQEKLGLKRSYLVQVNTGEEPQKAGVSPAGLPALLEDCRVLGLDVTGLMCIPPKEEPAGPHFALLARLAAAHDLDHLSMGMSADYETAIRFGATHIRLGSVVFGERPVLPASQLT